MRASRAGCVRAQHGMLLSCNLFHFLYLTRAFLFLLYAQVFTTFWPLGFVAFGGPQAHVAILRDHLVLRRDWITEDQFLELYAIGQVRHTTKAKQNCCFCCWVQVVQCVCVRVVVAMRNVSRD
jgi:Chromate transporter